MSPSVVMFDIEVTPQIRYAGNRAVLRTKVEVFVLDPAPQSFGDYAVDSAVLSVHADADTRIFENVRERLAGEQTAAIGVKNIWPPMASQSQLECLDTEVRGRL
ncbi:MAG: hypothetical protein IPG20_11330 [Gammaproteobacteria bacterium]|nr:hypothetical protein [Gammaproteobacteria bacterium]